MNTVTIRNYNFPIYFTHKGWNVKIADETGIFSMKDLKVRVKMEVDYEGISRKIAHATARMIKLKETQSRFGGLYSMTSMQEDSTVYQREYNHIVKLAEDFALKKGVIEYTIATNGGMLDRFFGQNVSAVEKMCQQVIERIDRTYGDVQNEFFSTLK